MKYVFLESDKPACNVGNQYKTSAKVHIIFVSIFCKYPQWVRADVMSVNIFE